MSGLIDIAGQRFGRLIVVARSDRQTRRGVSWICRCDCGSTKTVAGDSLRSGQTKSCGCWKAELCRAVNVTHGRTGTPEYKSWLGMIERCYRENCSSYPDYGARGVAVCDRWRNSFEAFLSDMGPKPTGKHEIDRFPDNDGNYEPANCRWATKREQARNRRSNRHLTHGGETRILTDWAAQLGIGESTIRRRLVRGWSVDRALGTPVR